MKDFLISTDTTADLPASYVKENNIDIHVDYALEMNNEHVADCFIEVNIKPKHCSDFHL